MNAETGVLETVRYQINSRDSEIDIDDVWVAPISCTNPSNTAAHNDCN